MTPELRMQCLLAAQEYARLLLREIHSAKLPEPTGERLLEQVREVKRGVEVCMEQK